MDEHARRLFGVRAVVERYMACIEEIYNLPLLRERLESVIQSGNTPELIQELVRQTRVEFDLPVEEDEST